MGFEMQLLTKQLETQVSCLMELREERDFGSNTVEGMRLLRSSREEGPGPRVMVWKCRMRDEFILYAGP